MINSGAVTKPEKATQNRIIKLFQNELGYQFLGSLHDKDNKNINEQLLTRFLRERGHTPEQINKVLYELTNVANNHGQSLYHNNKAVYHLLRYGVTIQVDATVPHETIQVIDWNSPGNNHFYIAEEVTILGQKEKRPDVVLYVNGIAIAVLELKNSRHDLAEGIRQNITNQQDRFIAPFFTTIQLVLAGNDSQGLRYGTVGTAEKYFLSWKEDEQDNEGYKIDKYLKKLCNKERLIELMYDFVLFDGGKKKLPRVHQYFGIKAAQSHVRHREGGIIWHTQGSGKSITMVLLAKWILENNPHARVLVITDRAELDKQIKRVFEGMDEKITRTSSGRELIRLLGETSPRLLCSLIHKFGPRDSNLKSDKRFEEFIRELENSPSPAVGEVFVFVDECHRTQSGRLHKVMKALLPNALFIGFTGTPLLKKDKATSLEVFGKYIHTYKFNEAVDDGVILDLMYEARDIDQRISSQERIDKWFAAATKNANDFKKAELKKKWGTMQKVLSSKSRMSKVVADIVFDFNDKPRLSRDAGNAILVASSILEACKYYELFQGTPLRGKCAVITSYNPQTKDITTEDTGANTESDKEYIYNTYINLLENVQAKPHMTKAETYEDNKKQLFIEEPATMKLLIVVDKLLTGFDAPSCTYLYIDKSMQDHGLFQAICRVNRLDGEDKEYGYIIDYMDLFKKVEHAVAVYTSELDYDDFNAEDCDILLKNRLEIAHERLDNALEELELLCEPVPAPKDDLDYMHYFCGNTEIADDLKSREMRRHTLYKAIAAFIRAYANILDELIEAGYSEQEIAHINERIKHYSNVREIIKKASGETIDLKAYEVDMRYLLDNYIQADDSVVISDFGDMTLIDIIVNTGIAEAIQSLPKGIRNNQGAVSETIVNNVRSRIIKDHLLDPAYFEEMSELLDSIIKQRKQNAIDYEEYLDELAKLAKEVADGKKDTTPTILDTPAKRALWSNLNHDVDLAIAVDAAIKEELSDNWRGNIAKENLIKQAVYRVLNDIDEVERIFNVIKQQRDY